MGDVAGAGFLGDNAVLVAQAVAPPDCDTMATSTGGAHLISGGLGGLGLLTARFLLERGAQRVVLASRSDRVVEGSDEDWLWLACSKSDVQRIRCDFCEEAAVLAAVRRMYGQGLPPSGVFHAAHNFIDASLINQTASNFTTSYGPKVNGARSLHLASLCAAYSYFNTFSSIAGMLGSPTQAPHAASSLTVSILADYRRQVGVRGQCSSWGPVGEIGYAARVGADHWAEESGFGAISRRQTQAALSSMLLLESRSFVVWTPDWQLLLPANANRQVQSILAPFQSSSVPARSRAVQLPASAGAACAGRGSMGAAPLDVVLGLVVNVAGREVDRDTPLMDAGVDSLSAVELRNQLQEVAGEAVLLPSTVVFDHPTARGLSKFFVEDESPDTPTACWREVSDAEVGLASQKSTFPGGARELPAAWQLVATALDTFVAAAPTIRWEVTTVHYASFIHSVQLFDNDAFRLSQPEVSSLDPQQRMVLELGYAALHGACLPRQHILESNMAVFVGVMSTEFRDCLPHPNAYAMTGTGHCFVAGRLSYVLGLHGASEAIDTACSSALVACHTAWRALQSCECQGAVLAGVNMMFLPATLDSYAASGRKELPSQIRHSPPHRLLQVDPPSLQDKAQLTSSLFCR